MSNGEKVVAMLHQEERRKQMEEEISLLTTAVKNLTAQVSTLADMHEDLSADIKGLVDAWKSSSWLLRAIIGLSKLIGACTAIYFFLKALIVGKIGLG